VIPVEAWTDARALFRHVGWLRPVRRVRARSVELAEAFDRVVRPVVDTVVRDPAARARAVVALRSAGVKLGFLAQEYAVLAGRPPRLELAVLVGAITRVYDDLFDRSGGRDLERRMHCLVTGSAFRAVNQAEALFAGIYREILGRLDRARDAAVFEAFAQLQAFQVRSWEQLRPGVADSAVDEITRGKGGYGMVVLFSAVAGPMRAGEATLVHDLGAVLQLLDDYQDVDSDVRAGVRTAATRGAAPLAEICGRLGVLEADFRRCFADIRPLYSVLYATLWMSFIRRRLPFLGAVMGTPRGALSTLLRRPAPLERLNGDL
jgi:hypothetical protein